MLCLVYFMELYLNLVNYGDYCFFCLVHLFFLHFYVLVKNYKSLLHFLLKWSVYRNLKNGLLIDYFLKYIYTRMLYSTFLIYAIFFNDKFFLEVLLFRLTVIGSFLEKYINSFSYSGVLKLLKFIVIIFIYFTVVFMLIFI